MNERPLTRAAAALLRRQTQPIPPPSENARARGIEAVRLALRAEKRRRMRLRVGFTMLAVAAAAVVVFGIARRHSVHVVPPAPSVVAYVDGTGASVVSGGHIIANGTSTIRLSTGTRITLDSPGELRVVEQGASQIYALENGALRADVAKLSPGQRFVVRTIDAEIEVHGTSFRVSLVKEDDCAPGVKTRVQVLEGVVTVRAKGLDDRLFAGDVWPRTCAIAPPAPSISAVPSSTTVAPVVSTAVPPKAKPAPSSVSPSVLAEQNDAFAAAVEAKKSGNVSLAIDRFGAFERKYPSSALAETAAVERMRLLAVTDKARAREAAQSYLLRYPNGSARALAQKLVDGS